MINKRYNVTIQVLTPLSIGQGSEKDWVYGIDYLTKKDENEQLWLYHLSLERMAAAKVDLNRLVQIFCKGKPSEANALLGTKLEIISDLRMLLPVVSAEALRNPIKTFLRNQLTNHPVLAGSSIKGAIRSILFTYFRDQNECENPSVFGKMNDGSDFMRFIRVGDFEFEETCLVNSKLFNLKKDGTTWIGGWKHSFDLTNTNYDPIGFNTIYECLIPGATAKGTISFSELLFNQIQSQSHRDKKIRIISGDDAIKNLCELINDHTFDYLDKEYTFFEAYNQATYQGNILVQIDALMKIINECEPNECVIKMSAGSGFHSITGDWQYEDYTGESNRLDRKRGGELPKSRKIVVSGNKAFSLMGFIKLRFELA